jgi:hypothetical protein
MSLRLIQFIDDDGERAVAASRDREPFRAVKGLNRCYELALHAIDRGCSIEQAIDVAGLGAEVDARRFDTAGRLLCPLDHPDPAHMLVTGTGLTHLGSAEARDRMHRDLAGKADLTDSMRMFKWGLEGGKPEGDTPGVQPEWFYKGDGSILVGPGEPLASPDFSLDGGEEPEIAGLYVIAPDGTPCRLGFALGNEFSDHVMERQNYLYLAHSKLRPCAIGPEILVGELPASIQGLARIVRGGETLWQKPFLSGERHMSHTIRNLEHHHFKYAPFRRPGDAHVHFFGTATISFSDGIQLHAGDTIEIEADAFNLPLRNTVSVAHSKDQRVRVL